jgi:dUTP pyrophosphatase
MKIKIKKIDATAVLPTRNKIGDAGYDLYSMDEGILRSGQRKLFSTGISISIPEGFYGRIAPRSGLAWKSGIDVLGGVIDSTYRGILGVILIYHDDNPEAWPFHVRKGDKIAQLIIEKCHDIEWEEVNVLDSSDRNENGFGSSGR